MFTTQIHFSIANDEALNQAVEAIIAYTQPELIICYGKRTKTVDAWSCFLQNNKPTIFRAYDLLIVTQNNSTKKEYEVVTSIENYNTSDFALRALVHKLSGVEDALKGGSNFFARAIHGGILLYNARQIQLNVQNIYVDDPQAKSSKAAQWEKWYGLAKKFSKGAAYYASNGYYDLATFMLHQAVEHTAIGLIRTHMDYRPASHNLKRLLGMIETFAPFSMDVFTRSSRDDEELFDILTRAYSDARYKDVYSVSEETVSALTDRINRLHRLSERLIEKLLKRDCVPGTVSPVMN